MQYTIIVPTKKPIIQYKLLDLGNISSNIKVLFLVAVPDNKSDTYEELIDELNLLLSNDEFRNKLINSNDKEEFINLFGSTQ